MSEPAQPLPHPYEAELQRVLATGGRVVILGAPRTGKSTLAASLARGARVMCADPADLAQEARPGVEYLPDSEALAQSHGDAWSGASEYVATYWLDRPGPWVMEGVGMARALRKWLRWHPGQEPPCERLLWLTTPVARQLPGQVAMGKGIRTVMADRALCGWLSGVLIQC